MGATPTLPVTTTNDKGETVYNGSPATYLASFPMIVENYPWVVWEEGNVLSEEYQLRLILEASLWGLTALALEVGSNIGGIALSADPDFPNGIGNDTGNYTVEQSFYTVAPIVRIVLGAAKCFMLSTILQFYITRLTEYGNSLPDTDTSKFIDIAFTATLPFLYIPYFYEIGFGVVDAIWWVPQFGKTTQI